MRQKECTCATSITLSPMKPIQANHLMRKSPLQRRWEACRVRRRGPFRLPVAQWYRISGTYNRVSQKIRRYAFTHRPDCRMVSRTLSNIHLSGPLFMAFRLHKRTLYFGLYSGSANCFVRSTPVVYSSSAYRNYYDEIRQERE